MKEESAELKMLVAELRLPGAVRQVRLVRVVEWRYYREFPERRKGIVNARRMNESIRAKKEGRDVEPESGSTLVEWLSEKLVRKPTPVKNLLTRGRRIPAPVLSALEDRKISGVGVLLDRLAKEFHKDPETDWQKLVDLHVNGAPLPEPKGIEVAELFQRGAIHSNRHYALFASDSRSEMELLVKQRVKFDAIVTDPPYGQGRTDIPDDREGSFWAVPLFAQLVKPGGVVCIWTGEGQVNRWMRACLDVGLGVSGLVLWDKGTGRRHHTDKELMIVCGVPPFDPMTVKYAKTADDAPERDAVGTPKSPELMVDVLERFTKPGDWVLDPFMGTGPVGVAAVGMGRFYFGAELDTVRMMFAAGKIKEAWRAKRGVRVTNLGTIKELAKKALAERAA